ncbi:MAG: NTP transferase domain-containing protein [Lentimicrobium sp.]
MDAPERLCCIILSAGNSGRMGMHKALLPFGHEKMTFLEKISASYQQAGIDRQIVVINKSLHRLFKSTRLSLSAEVEIVVNPYPENGRFYSLQAGMMKVGAGSYVFIQNADNPFSEPELLVNMIENRTKAGVIIPSYSGKTGHPVLINPVVCESIRLCKNPDTRLDYFLSDFPSFSIESNNRRILVNINTPDDYSREFDGGIYLR